MSNIAYLLSGLVITVFLLQWYIHRKAKSIEGTSLPALEPEIDSKLTERGKVLLYFYSPSCGPCRAMAPIIDRLIENYDNVFKFDITCSLELPRRLGVMATPTILLLTDTLISKVIVGSASMKTLKDLLD